MDAHLVLDGAAEQPVALRRRVPSASVGTNFGTMNSEMPFVPVRRVRQARQHQVHDVLRHVVLAGGNEDLVAGDPVAAVGLRLGLRAQHAEVGAAVRLGQAHGAGPFARDELRQVQLLLLVGAVLSRHS